MHVFITGLSGSLGSSLARLHHARGNEVHGCARSEQGAVRWLADPANRGVATLLVANASELAEPVGELALLLPRIDRLYHCAAMKHVELCEAHPDEATWQNAALTSLVAGACADLGVELVFASTDKACLPQGVYGATKLVAERCVLRHGGAVVRLGNLAGSRGSVFCKWRDAAAKGEPIRLTDPDMTRYFLSLDEAAAFMADRCVLGRVAIPHPLKAARMGELATATGCRVEVTGPRPGESRHQWLAGPDELVDVRHGEGRLVLGEGGGPGGMGILSSGAPRWDARELLEVGGFFR